MVKDIETKLTILIYITMRGKLFLSLFILNLCIGFALSAQSEKDCIYIHGNQSPVNDLFYHLDEIDKITFSEDAMNLHIKDVNMIETLYFSDFSLITFCDNPVTGVETNTSHKGVDVRYNNMDYSVAVSSPTLISSIQIFDLSGKVLQSLSPHDVNATVVLSTYPSGVYIIRVANSESIITEKIVKH